MPTHAFARCGLAVVAASLALALSLVLRPAAAEADGASSLVFVPPAWLSPEASSARTPAVASDELNGAVAAWTQIDAEHKVVVADQGAGNAWSAPVAIPGSDNGEDPAIAMSRTGHVVVAWTAGGDVWASVRRNDGTGFGPAQALASSTGPGINNWDHHVSINADGAAFVVWEHADLVSSRVEARVAPPGGPFGAVEVIASPTDAYAPEGGIDTVGNRAVVFSAVDSDGNEDDDTMLALAPAGGTFAAPTVIGARATSANGVTTDPRIAVSGPGGFVAAWQGVCADTENCTAQHFVQAALGRTTTGVLHQTRLTNPGSGGGGGTGTDLVSRGWEPVVAIDEQSRAIVAWYADQAPEGIYAAFTKKHADLVDFSEDGFLPTPESLGFTHSHLVASYAGAGAVAQELQATMRSGRGVLAWVDTPGGQRVQVADAEQTVIDAAAWSVQAVHPEGSRPDSIDLATSAGGQVVVVGRNSDAARIFVSATAKPKPSGEQPIIFLPGVMGSYIHCGPRELWPNLSIPFRPDLAAMTLQPDGVTNRPGSCSGSAAANGEIIMKILNGQKDYYEKTVTQLGTLGPVVPHGYDWRRSPDHNVAGLDARVRQVVRESGSGKVRLVGFSMGGLVAQAYVDDPVRARNVSRVVTLATPYWGSPRSWFPIRYGWVTPDNSDIGEAALDTLWARNSRLAEFARTSSGLYSLLPSDRLNERLGGWLSQSRQPGGSITRASQAQVGESIQRTGGQQKIFEAVRAFHRDRIDGFRTNGVEYHQIASSGLPTVTAVAESEVFGEPVAVRVTYGDGDGVVPILSQTQGMRRLGDGAPLGDRATVHLICGVRHGDADHFERDVLPAFRRAMAGEPAQATTCSASAATEIVFVNDPIFGPLPVAARGRGDVRAAAAQRTLPISVRRAVTSGEAELTPAGGGSYRLLVTDPGVVLDVPATRVRVRTLTAKGAGWAVGAPRDFVPAPAQRTIRITTARPGRLPVVRAGRAVLRPFAPDVKAPKVLAVARKVGRMAVVTVTATDPAGIASIAWRRTPKAKPIVLRGRQFRVPWTALATVRVTAVDRAGNASVPGGVRATSAGRQ